MYGAKVSRSMATSMRLCGCARNRETSRSRSSFDQSVSIEGKNRVLEIIDLLGDAPDILCCRSATRETSAPTGAATKSFGRSAKQLITPRMLGFQAADSAPVYYDRIIEQPETVATAIRIGNPASWKLARAAVRDSGGCVDIVTDREILDAQSWLAANEGIFVEPASAASIAGIFRCHREPRCACCPFSSVPEGSRIVCTVTGHGLKDPEVAREHIRSITTASAEKNAFSICSQRPRASRLSGSKARPGNSTFRFARRSRARGDRAKTASEDPSIPSSRPRDRMLAPDAGDPWTSFASAVISTSWPSPRRRRISAREKLWMKSTIASGNSFAPPQRDRPRHDGR